MQIIDFKKKGNLVRFYLGKDDLLDWYGDDWNDYPYELNAGLVYEEFVCGFCDVVFPFEMTVAEPADDWRNSCNSEWSKNDMKARRVPCIAAVFDNGYLSDNDFSKVIADKTAVKFYFGDKMKPHEFPINFGDEVD